MKMLNYGKHQGEEIERELGKGGSASDFWTSGLE